jgi:hypothetical protein
MLSGKVILIGGFSGTANNFTLFKNKQCQIHEFDL